MIYDFDGKMMRGFIVLLSVVVLVAVSAVTIGVFFGGKWGILFLTVAIAVWTVRLIITKRKIDKEESSDAEQN